MSKKPFRAVSPVKRETSSERRKRTYTYSSRAATPDRMAASLGKWAVTLHVLSNGTSVLPMRSWVRVLSTNNYTYNVTTGSCPCCQCTQIFRNVEPHWLDFDAKQTLSSILTSDNNQAPAGNADCEDSARDEVYRDDVDDDAAEASDSGGDLDDAPQGAAS